MQHTMDSPLDPMLITVLQHMAQAQTPCSAILPWLRTQVVNRNVFEAHFLAAFCDQRDESLLWIIAGRWWHGDISEDATNRLFARAHKPVNGTH